MGTRRQPLRHAGLAAPLTLAGLPLGLPTDSLHRHHRPGRPAGWTCAGSGGGAGPLLQWPALGGEPGVRSEA